MTDKQTVKFGDICKEVKLTTKDPIGDGYERYIGLEHLDSGSLKIKRWGMIVEDSPSFTRVFKKGQLLFGKRRPYLKKAAIAEFDGICSGDIIVMEPLDNLSEPELLKFIVQSEKFWQHAVNTSSGSLSPRTKYKEIAKLVIELPCFREQKKLYAALSKVQSTRVLNDELLSMSSRLESSTLNELCFGCGDNKGFWGSYSKHFDEMALGELTLESAFGPRYPSDKYSENGSVGTIRTTDFDDNAQVNYQSIPMAELDEVKFR
ncbi:MAG: restriction endonuclease subunit S, partial [Flavobacteriaceae bacterium]